MGYYTYHTGEIASGNASEKDVAIAIAQLPYFIQFFDGDLSDAETNWIETIDDVIANELEKWYTCVADMKKISKQFPGVTIKIHGEGEENGDLWDAYFKDGKSAVYKAQIIYPKFKEGDLQQ